MRVLICGDRNWLDKDRLFMVMDLVHDRTPVTCVIEGEAKGADVMGKAWAFARKITWQQYPANWAEHHRAAGPIRNLKMLAEGKPDVVYAFHNHLERSKGTAHMIKIARKAGLTVWHVTSDTLALHMTGPAIFK